MSFIVNRFAYIVLGASILAFIYPSAFTWFSGKYLISVGLGIIMLGMGLTLTKNDFAEVWEKPTQVLLGVILQFTLMPSLGYILARIFELPPPFAAGLILVACCPGGTASNVITFLARCDVALSVSMTAVSTMAAVLLTPFLTAMLAGSRVEVNPWALVLSTVQIVLLPVVAGVLLREFFTKTAEKLLPIAPVAAVLMITLIVASVIGARKEKILESGLSLLFSIFTLHGLGFFLGYFFSALTGKSQIIRRTISIEVGMQNSGLGVALAVENFSSPFVAIPSAISSLTHSLLGSLLAAFWSKKNLAYKSISTPEV